jgi:hypothetical protein
MRRLTLLMLLTCLLLFVTAVGAHADYWPPDMIRTLLGTLP